ncbi:MAG: hypothetical protein J0H40_17070 [Rhizobiales bacterium]|nr:hypothetical protein [Hyphomicrobiales bacterium]
MLKKIFSAIVAGLKAIGRLVGGVVTAPFRALDAAFGGGSDVPPLPAATPETEDVPAPSKTEDLTKVYEQVALAVMQWCVESLTADAPASMPANMPRKIAEWLPRLTREECFALGCAEYAAVYAHIRSSELLTGVRSVRPLERVEWPPEPRPAPGTGGLISDPSDEASSTFEVGSGVL